MSREVAREAADSWMWHPHRGRPSRGRTRQWASVMQHTYHLGWHFVIGFCPLDLGSFLPRNCVEFLQREQQMARRDFIMISSWLEWGQNVDLENYCFSRVWINPVPDPRPFRFREFNLKELIYPLWTGGPYKIFFGHDLQQVFSPY